MPSSAPTRPDPTRERYEALLEVAESIASHRQLSTLFPDLSRCLHRLVAFDFITLTLLDDNGSAVRLHLLETERTIVGPTPESTPIDQTATGLALATRHAVYVPDLDRETRFPIIFDLLRANGIHSYCALPLFTAQRDLGGIHFGSLRTDAYRPEDIEFMEHVARQVAVAVDNALNSESTRAYEEQLARERDRLRTLLEINNAVVQCLATRQLFQAISSSLRRTFGLDYVSLLIYDAEIQALRLQALDFPDGSGLIREDAIVPLEGTLAGHVFRTRQGCFFTLGEAGEISQFTREIMSREGLNSLGCIPLITRSAVVGTLNLGSRREKFFTAEDLQFFTQAAGQVAIALDNALSYTRIEELNARLAEEKVYLEDEIRTDNRFEEIIGQSRALRAILKQVETVAPTDSTVLIYGETGTGKELLARAIHDLSGAAAGDLRQAELRGHSHRAARERDVRPREGRLHGRHRAAHRALRAGAPRHACSWTRSAKSRWSCRPSCCACCRSGNSSAWAARAPSAPTRGWWRPPTATFRPWWKIGNSAPISITG